MPVPVNGVASFSQAHVGYIAGKLCATPLLQAAGGLNFHSWHDG